MNIDMRSQRENTSVTMVRLRTHLGTVNNPGETFKGEDGRGWVCGDERCLSAQVLDRKATEDGRTETRQEVLRFCLSCPLWSLEDLGGKWMGSWPKSS